MLRFSHALAIAAAAAVVSFATAGPALAAPPETTTDPAAAAAGWLAQQFTDHIDYAGSSFFDGGTTADVIFALAASKTGQDKISSAISYFAAHVSEYTSISDTSGQPGPFDGAVAKTAAAALVAGVDPRTFGGFDLLTALKQDECTSVSAPTSSTDFTTPVCPAIGAARNIFSSISESLAILAEARGMNKYGSTYGPSTSAVSYFLSLQCPDGGFTSNTTGGSGCTSDVDATGYAVPALVALGGHATELARATGWLVSSRNAHGYWLSQGGPNVDSTGLAASALVAAGQDSSTSRAWLVTQQVTTGPTLGRGASRGALKYQGAFSASSSFKATADGLLGLARGVSLTTLTAHGSAPGTAVLTLAVPQAALRSVRQSGTQTVTGTGFSAGEQVRATLDASTSLLGHAKATPAGTASVRFEVPSSLSVGTHRVALTGATSGLSSVVSFTVAAQALPAPSSTATSAPALADTGRDTHHTSGEIALGLGCVLVGGAALVAGRRRRT